MERACTLKRRPTAVALPLRLVLLLLCLAPLSARAQQAAPAPRDTTEGVRIEHPIPFKADTLDLVFSDSLGDRATLTRNARVTYDGATLDAYRLVLAFDDEEVTAVGFQADSGLVGKPQFDREDEAFSSDRIAFNFATERGRFEGAQTQFDDGYLKARVVGIGRDSVVLARDGIYTTCECVDDPSYSLHASRLKVEDRWIYTGPIQLYLYNIPTPLWLPFGILPNVEGRRAGPTSLDYGEQGDLGFFIKGIGWYFPVSDYLDVTVQGDAYTSGSWEIRPRLRYAKRYAYSGGLELDVRAIATRRGDGCEFSGAYQRAHPVEPQPDDRRAVALQLGRQPGYLVGTAQHVDPAGRPGDAGDFVQRDVLDEMGIAQPDGEPQPAPNALDRSGESDVAEPVVFTRRGYAVSVDRRAGQQRAVVRVDSGELPRHADQPLRF